jgi:hypothetical protein
MMGGVDTVMPDKIAKMRLFHGNIMVKTRGGGVEHP